MYIPFLNRWLVKVWERWARAGTESRPRFQLGDVRLTLRHNWRFRVSVTFFALLLVGLCLIAWLNPKEFWDESPWALWFVRISLSLFVPSGLIEMAGAFRHRVLVDESGIVIVPAVGRRGSVLWSEVAEVMYGREGESISVVTKAGRKHRISTFLNGYPYLRERLEAVTEADLID